MENKLSKYALKKNLKTVGILSEFFNSLKTKDYKPVYVDGQIATIGSKGVRQAKFVNPEGREVLIRVSQNLWNRIENEDDININDLPIYDLGVDGIPELVIGLTGGEDLESVPDNFSNDQLVELLSKSVSNLFHK